MITYELAKQLKDAGFPLKSSSHEHVDGVIFDDGEYYKIPTLSELIEACNSVFFVLEKLKDGWGCNDHYIRETGKSPEESVANLWLLINKK